MNLIPADKVYVVGFVTDGDEGGYEWRLDRENAETIRSGWIAKGDADVSEVVEVATADLGHRHYPKGIAAWKRAITEALDERPDLWEPTHGQNRQETPA